ncbi:MAG: exopolyphosphatase [Xanthomonadales bacterium]|jgi:exopolyphosphatase/guanosine-5'-triphosphate,3'-diphosphate pyrophosphatase|nr:exopolyphosphatase [Xanthomonadales bacterium]MBN8795010.1 exopolyphosphatase [Stenotrophomonas nitritireducens]
MSTVSPRPGASLRDGDLVAALDLGSNSFHIVVAQRVLGQLRVVDRLRETVRMAEGLNALGGLAPEVRERALACLARFGQRVADIPRRHVRAVATNTVRQLRDPEAFLRPAEAALGHPIDVISGREEARLVYLGVAHEQPPEPEQKRLVIDIGGGSTECIIGRGFTPLERESLQVGCIASTRRFFDSGKLGRKRWQAALTEVELQFQQFAAPYRSLGWDEAIGTSGTHKAIGNICAAMKLGKGSITREGLAQVRERLLQAGRIEDIDLPGLSDDRRPIIAGGVLVLEAAFAVLGLEQLQVSKAALREGVLYDLLGRGGADDPRELSVAALMQRYGVDAAQAQRVESTALQLFDQVAADWGLGSEDRAMLSRAARLHELGLAIAHSSYHVHGAYVLQHSDIAGFSQQGQRFLAALVRSHRRSVAKSAFESIPDRLLGNARRCAALLRLAVLLHRARKDELPPGLRLHADGERLELALDRRWLHARPLLRADLEAEPDDMLGLGLQLHIAQD